MEDVKIPTTEKDRTERRKRKAAIEARMTPQQRHTAQRKRVDAFMQKRSRGPEPRPSTPTKPQKSGTPTKSQKPKTSKPELPWWRNPFPGLTGPDGALGRKE